MRIALLAQGIDFGTAGVGTYTRNLVEALLSANRSHEYSLVHAIPDSNSFFQKYRGREVVVPLPKVPFAKEAWKLWTLPHFLRTKDFNIVHALDLVPPFWERGASFRRVLTIHDLTNLKFPAFHHFHSFWYTKVGLSLTLPNVDHVITVSKTTKEDFLAFRPWFPPDNVSVIHEGVGEKFQPRKKDTRLDQVRRKYRLPKTFILHVGTLEPRKNIPTLLKAFAILRNKDFRHSLVLVGKKGWKYHPIIQSIENHPYSKRIHFLETISNEDLPYFYNLASLFVFPSFYEGFGLPALEAMASGCPALLSDTSSLREIAPDRGSLILPQDVEGWARAMEKALTDFQYRSHLIHKGVQQAKNFSWRKTARQTQQIYESLLLARTTR